MANQSFLSVWLKQLREEQIAERLSAFLTTVPSSQMRPGFTHLVIRSVDSAEPPALEHDLRATPVDTAGILELIGEQIHSDSSYEISSAWDLGVFDAPAGKSTVEPQPLTIVCRGEEYDDGFWKEAGHFEVNLGFEHFFTGHAGLLGLRPGPKAAPQSIEESRFLEALAWPENLEKYQKQTRDNIRRLQDWVRRIETSLPVERFRLWSEGEENFEARLDEIATAR